MTDRMTIGQVVNAMIEIGSDRDKAEALFARFVREAQEEAGMSLGEARARVSGNLGYMMGYAPKQIDVKMWQDIGCKHPIFGDLTKPVSPEAAFQKGLEMGKKLRK